MRSSVLYSGRGRGLHHSGMPLVCAASETGSKQNSISRASLVQKLTIPPGSDSLDCAGRVQLWYSLLSARANFPAKLFRFSVRLSFRVLSVFRRREDRLG